MRKLIDIIEEASRSNVVYHSTEWGPEIYRDGQIKANSTIDVSDRASKASDMRHDSDHRPDKGVCVTRSLHFAKQFSDTIFVLDVEKLRHNFRMIPRAEAGAYDLADDHGDFRIEAEEFVICPGIDLDRYCTEIWVAEHLSRDRDVRPITLDARFQGFFKPV